MNTKTCYNCKEKKELLEFHKNKAKKDGHAGTCKECRKKVHREHYLKNKDKYKTKAKQYRNILKNEIAEIKKNQPCADCGGFFFPWQMDFDHIGDDKDREVARMAHEGSRKKILDEIKKCELVCSNCHRHRTHLRFAAIAKR